jgi:hypothetical protein
MTGSDFTVNDKNPEIFLYFFPVTDISGFCKRGWCPLKSW